MNFWIWAFVVVGGLLNSIAESHKCPYSSSKNANPSTVEGDKCCFHNGNRVWADACDNRPYEIKHGRCMRETCAPSVDDLFMERFVNTEKSVVICDGPNLPFHKHQVTEAPRSYKCLRGEWEVGTPKVQLPIADGIYLMCVSEKATRNGRFYYYFGGINCNEHNYKLEVWMNKTKDVDQILGDTDFIKNLAESFMNPPAHETTKQSFVDEINTFMQQHPMWVWGALFSAAYLLITTCFYPFVRYHNWLYYTEEQVRARHVAAYAAIGNFLYFLFLEIPKKVAGKMCFIPKYIVRQMSKCHFPRSNRGQSTNIDDVSSDSQEMEATENPMEVVVEDPLLNQHTSLPMSPS